MPHFFSACAHCQSFDWCQRRGCITWNGRSRDQYEELKRRAKESNDWIDEFIALQQTPGA